MIKEEIEPKKAYWFLLGPVFFLLCLFVLELKVSLLNGFYLFGLLLSLICFVKWKKAALFVFFALCISHFFLSLHESFWEKSLSFSLALSWIITAYGFEEGSFFLHESLQKVKDTSLEKEDLQKEWTKTQYALKDNISSYEKQLKEKDLALQEKEKLSSQKIVELKNEFFKLEEEGKRKASSFEKNINELKREKESTSLEALLLEKKTLALHAALQEGKRQIADLQKELERKQALQDALNEARIDKFQYSLFHDSLLDEAKTKEKEISSLKDMVQETQQSDLKKEKDLEQMRRQFEEKAEVLQETRKELFQMEGKCIALEREIEQKEIEANPNEHVFVAHLQEVEEEKNHLENEVAHLEEIVSEVFGKKKPEKKVTRKKKVQKKSRSSTLSSR